MSAADGATQLDARSLDALRARANRDPKAAVKETARQFEGLFMQELMKGMRKSVGENGTGDNAGSKLGVELLDSQYATRMTGQPNGLADAIARQLERQMLAGGAANAAVAPGAMNALDRSKAGSGLAMASATPAAALLAASRAAGAVAPAGAAGAPSGAAGEDGYAAAVAGLTPSQRRQAAFVHTHTAAAQAAEAQTGIPANFMVAQAAHESGWGRREIHNADGTPSHNVFGIKAGAGWEGKVATVTTTEYIDGAPRKVQAKFRAYDSYDEAFQDYARLMTESPRYAGVVAKVAAASAAGTAASAAGFASGLQRAGYATDPAYASKLTAMINTTLRLQRAMA